MQVTEGSGNVLDDLGLTREDMVEVARKREEHQKEVDKADRETRFIRDLRACFNTVK